MRLWNDDGLIDWHSIICHVGIYDCTQLSTAHNVRALGEFCLGGWEFCLFCFLSRIVHVVILKQCLPYSSSLISCQDKHTVTNRSLDIAHFGCLVSDLSRFFPASFFLLHCSCFRVSVSSPSSIYCFSLSPIQDKLKVTNRSPEVTFLLAGAVRCLSRWVVAAPGIMKDKAVAQSIVSCLTNACQPSVRFFFFFLDGNPTKWHGHLIQRFCLLRVCWWWFCFGVHQSEGTMKDNAVVTWGLY